MKIIYRIYEVTSDIGIDKTLITQDVCESTGFAYFEEKENFIHCLGEFEVMWCKVSRVSFNGDKPIVVLEVNVHEC